MFGRIEFDHFISKLKYLQFLRTFKPLIRKQVPIEPQLQKELAMRFLVNLDFEFENMYQFGKTKVTFKFCLSNQQIYFYNIFQIQIFLRALLGNNLNKQLRKIEKESAQLIQSYYRMYRIRQQYAKMRSSAIVIQRHLRNYFRQS